LTHFVRYVLATLVLYGWSVIPFVYIQSFLCNVASTAYTWVTVFNIFSGTHFISNKRRCGVLHMQSVYVSVQAR